MVLKSDISLVRALKPALLLVLKPDSLYVMVLKPDILLVIEFRILLLTNKLNLYFHD